MPLTMGRANLTASVNANLVLEDGSKISARPSGTEPKIKFYFSVNTTIKSAAEFDSIQVHGELDKKIQGIISDMGLK